MKIIYKLTILFLLLLNIQYGKAQTDYKMYYDTLSVSLSDAIECIIFPKYIKDGKPEITDDWIKSVYESKEMYSYIKVILGDELQAVVDYLRITESQVIYVEMKSLGINIRNNEYSFIICIKYIPDKDDTYEVKNTEVHK